jgi:predicted nucleic acid-binding protein
MNLFVDTSVWSLAFRRDSPASSPQVALLNRALEEGGSVFTTGLVLQELLQGFHGPKAAPEILSRFSELPFVIPERDDHVAAAKLRSACRRDGVQIGTIDALLAQLCIRYRLAMLTADSDFERVAQRTTLTLA